MTTIRGILEDFLCTQIEKLVQIVEQGGEEATFYGYPAVHDNDHFMRGELMRNALSLAIRRCKAGDPRGDEMFATINALAYLLDGYYLGTWGKLRMLEGLAEAQDENLLHKLTDKTLEIFRIASDYEDFLDKENLLLKHGLPTNYYHVAMGCAGFREKLGWENDGMADKLCDKFIGIMEANSSAGWADEQPPFGRFDNYTLNSPMEIAIALRGIHRELPDSIRKNLRGSAVLSLKLRNNKGTGFVYGRSIAAHGDIACALVLSEAMMHGLLAEEEKNQAIPFIGKALEKLRCFWFDEEMGCFNLWLKGRATNSYRNLTRILQVSLDMYAKLTLLLNNAEACGYADSLIPASDFGRTDGWSCEETVFDEGDGKKRALYILRNKDLIFSLPLVGTGSYATHAAYQPFPALPQFMEAAQEATHPFLVPWATLADGKTAIPAGGYETIGIANTENGVVITAQGRMTVVDPTVHDQEPTFFGRFAAEYRFEDKRIDVTFRMEGDVESVRMLYAGEAKITGNGFDSSRTFTPAADDPDFHTPHGALTKGIEWTGTHPVVGYTVDLSDKL